MLPAEPPPALLLADDTPSIRQLLSHLLLDVTPWEVVAVPDAAAALAVLAARPVPLVIADYHLPDMNGDTLATTIKARSPDTKIVIITADIEFDGSNQWPHVDVCLIKPFRLHELVTTIGTLLPNVARARVVGPQKHTAR
jgi:CheY-like chemotaxis protein